MRRRISAIVLSVLAICAVSFTAATPASAVSTPNLYNTGGVTFAYTNGYDAPLKLSPGYKAYNAKSFYVPSGRCAYVFNGYKTVKQYAGWKTIFAGQILRVNIGYC